MTRFTWPWGTTSGSACSLFAGLCATSRRRQLWFSSTSTGQPP
uniref:Uncharacterized protein n=1 Tax=Arundo donax TaxID=35708 RepID=A0A0A8ZIH5_ARUDO